MLYEAVSDEVRAHCKRFCEVLWKWETNGPSPSNEVFYNPSQCFVVDCLQAMEKPLRLSESEIAYFTNIANNVELV